MGVWGVGGICTLEVMVMHCSNSLTVTRIPVPQALISADLPFLRWNSFHSPVGTQKAKYQRLESLGKGRCGKSRIQLPCYCGAGYLLQEDLRPLLKSDAQVICTDRMGHHYSYGKVPSLEAMGWMIAFLVPSAGN